MDPSQVFDRIADKTAQTAPFKEVTQRLEQGASQVLVHGMPTALQAFLLTHLQRQIQGTVLVVAADEDRAEQWRDDLQAIAGDKVVRYFPDWDVGPYEGQSPSVESTGMRLEAAAQVLRGGATIVVTWATALLKPMLPPRALKGGTLVLKKGAQYAPDRLVSHLLDCGFEQVPVIDGVGQFSSRGGILDVYPFGLEHPLRLEFFGDELESIRHFDVSTQRSKSTADEARILPAREVLLIAPFYEEFLASLERAEEAAHLAELRDQIELGTDVEGVESALNLLYGGSEGLFDYLQQPLIFRDEEDDVTEQVEKGLERIRRDYQRGADKEELLDPEAVVKDGEWLQRKLADHPCVQQAPVGQMEQAVRFEAQEAKVYQGELGLLNQELDRLEQEDYTVHIRCETQAQLHRLEEIFAARGEALEFGQGTLHRGFIFPQAQLALFNDHEIFSRQKRRYRYRRFKTAAPIATFKALQFGDFVVHVDHGIGRYSGVKRLRISNREHDCLQVTYQGTDKVFVPVEQLDRLRKYSTAEGEIPFLSKLGGTAWEKLKERTREEIFKMAGELVQLYAERKSQPGFAFQADTPMQRELEAAFPFEETPDQLRTMEEVRGDMEQASCMDRLVCGDVGYGKTEVAVRAAFKAIADHKQVAVLVPTTILVEQHCQTFAERMASLPVRVEGLSRFRTAKEQKGIVEDVKSGKVDVLVGTHRMLSKDVRFRDLGLLVVDEEQRFGVRHKEKLKQFKRQVDVLTLTATPIPRTLHMSMMGARDMSVINTPPRDRLPIHTEIIAFDEERVIEAIHREVERGGQVYFVHNRVQSIYRLSEYLADLLPEVRFGVAHGQMPARELEKIMHDFMERKYDCLVCTMIIESGIDIPSVNTILVNRADTLGLSQLYQIRGRVGRSNERAYAYLLVTKGKKLNQKSRMRLRAIEEFADLGSGFNIAMRDMEIRGAGNLLGAQQHGFITAVGFDLYCRLLDEAMRELKGETVAEAVDPDIQIPVTAYIPDDYIPGSDQKMEFYQRLADALRIVELLAIEEEMVDRFGRLPPETQSLLYLMEIKIMARQLGVAQVQLEKRRFRLLFSDQLQLSRTDIQQMVSKSSAQLEFTLGEALIIEVPVSGRDDEERLERARSIMQEIV
ncbi:MAG: transcription-repair coupling factor [Candidatus Latescibacteria bacterium]|nr:transcription-repair coupling factor [Candidatus Latescibacterota bacterium]